jgi:multisubunit Na+/H+ antiporter MnhE subunit
MKLILKPYYYLEFLVFYLYKLVESNLIIAYDILTPKMRGNPVFLRVPLFLESNLGLLLFSNLISMTPGTLSIDIDENRKILLVHVLYSKGEDKMQEEFKRLQKKISRLAG